MFHTLTVGGPAMPMAHGRPMLEPVRLSGHEGVNRLFEYELLLKTADWLGLPAFERAADLDLDAFNGRELSCTIELDGTGTFVAGATGVPAGRLGAGTREINALITEAQFWGEEGRQYQYKLTLRPWLYLATLASDCKVFQNKSVIDILDELLADYPFAVERRLRERYPQRDYQVQYNESDFAFFERLCQEWGISYHFEHGEGKHRLVLTDSAGGFRLNPSVAYRQVAYRPPGLRPDAEYLHSWAPTHRVTSGRYVATDYDYTQPRANLTQRYTDPRPTGQADGEIYQWHAGKEGAHWSQPRAGNQESNLATTSEQGRLLALLRMQQLRTAGARAQASGNLRGRTPGHTFMLSEHPRRSVLGEYLILDTRLLIEDVGQTSQIAHAATERSQRWRVEVDLTAHPHREPLRPAFTRAKPHTHGPQTARVVGPEGQNLWTDEFGRIKVQFPWDRIGGNDQHSSCWVRVSAPWAGNQLGGIHIPRIGQEVVVDFIGGDPDQPICTGRVANQVNMPPWQLPGQSALSGFRTRELKDGFGNGAAGRSNHLVMDDTAGQIQAQIKSDHQHSSLSLGHITRVEDNEGRKDARGQGAEFRTDGHMAIRAGAGLLVSTDARLKATGHITSMDEALGRVGVAQRQHQTLANLAQQCLAQDGQDQSAVASSIDQQRQSIAGTGQSNPQAGQFPELSAPHVVISSPEGIHASAARALHLASGEHLSATSGGHASVSAQKSFLASAKEAIRLFAYNAGMRLIAGRGDIDIQALKDSIHLLAQLNIHQSAERITISARKELQIEGAGSYSRYSAAGIESGTKGRWVCHAAGHSFAGPRSIPLQVPQFASASAADEQLQIDHRYHDDTPVAGASFEVELPDGSTRTGKLDANGRASVSVPGATTARVRYSPAAGPLQRVDRTPTPGYNPKPTAESIAARADKLLAKNNDKEA